MDMNAWCCAVKEKGEILAELHLSQAAQDVGF